MFLKARERLLRTLWGNTQTLAEEIYMILGDQDPIKAPLTLTQQGDDPVIRIIRNPNSTANPIQYVEPNPLVPGTYIEVGFVPITPSGSPGFDPLSPNGIAAGQPGGPPLPTGGSPPTGGAGPPPPDDGSPGGSPVTPPDVGRPPSRNSGKFYIGRRLNPSPNPPPEGYIYQGAVFYSDGVSGSDYGQTGTFNFEQMIFTYPPVVRSGVSDWEG